MKYIIIISLLGVLILSACGPSQEQIQSTVQVSIAQTQTANPTATIAASATARPTPTRSSTRTPRPTSTLAGKIYGWRDLGEIESGGLVIQIRYIALAEKKAIVEQNFSAFPQFDNTPVVATILFKITNNTDKTLGVYPDQGTVIAGSEQIELVNFFFATYGDEVGGDIFPGVTKLGGIWFGFQRMAIEDIQNLKLRFDGPHDENFNRTGNNFAFDIDLTERRYDQMPSDVK